VRGGPRILEKVEDILGVKADGTTADLKFTVKRVNCIGCCALGPVMVVDDDYHGKLTPGDVQGILARYE
jgi:NADH-quinone oxidoreductase subunit E